MAFWDKVSNVFFHPVEEEEDMMDQRQEMAPPQYQSQQSQAEPREYKEYQDVFREQELKKTRRGQVVPIPGQNKALEMILIKAERYDDMQTIAKHIKDRRVVIVNFEEMPQDIAQRMVDFLSGAVFALDGVPKKVSGATFVFSSSQVDLEGNIMGDEGFAKGNASANNGDFPSFNFFKK